MKQRTVNRLWHNYCRGKSTKMGNYTYTLQWNPMNNSWWIVRCPVGHERDEYITVDGLIDSYWEWLEPVTITD